jgi:hypothetical protein
MKFISLIGIVYLINIKLFISSIKLEVYKEKSNIIADINPNSNTTYDKLNNSTLFYKDITIHDSSNAIYTNIPRFKQQYISNTPIIPYYGMQSPLNTFGNNFYQYIAPPNNISPLIPMPNILSYQQNNEFTYYYRDNYLNKPLPALQYSDLGPIKQLPRNDVNDIKIIKDNHIIDIGIHPHPKRNLKLIPM